MGGAESPFVLRAGVGALVLSKQQVDGMIKDKKHKVWPADVKIALTYRLDPAALPHAFVRAVLESARRR